MVHNHLQLQIQGIWYPLPASAYTCIHMEVRMHMLPQHTHTHRDTYIFLRKKKKSKRVIVSNKQPRQINLSLFFFLIMYRFLQRTSTIFRYQWKHTASQHCWATPSLCHPFPKCQQALAQQVHECQAQCHLHHADGEAGEPSHLAHTIFRQTEASCHRRG